MRNRIALTLALAVAAMPFVAGCAADEPEESSDDSALTEVKILQKNVGFPSALVATEKHVYYGANEFVGSGDPELDQQFAFWDGKIFRAPIGGGKAQLVDDVGPAQVIRIAGSFMYGFASDHWFITRVKISGSKPGQSETVFQDPETAESGEGEPSPIAGFEISGDQLVVVRTPGEIMTMKLDGSEQRTVQTVNVANSRDSIEAFAIVGRKVMVVTSDHSESKVPAALYSVDLDTAKKSKLFTWKAPPSNLATDGTTLYWSAASEIDGKLRPNSVVMALDAGSKTPRVVASDLGGVTDIEASGGALYLADHARGSIYRVTNPSAASPTRKKIAAASGILDLAVSGGSLVTGSQKDSAVVGTVGVMKIPAP